MDGWLALHGRHGHLAIAEVLEPARAYAVRGFPASPLLAFMVPQVAHVVGADDYVSAPVETGTVITRPGVARTLAAIADGGWEAFYEGEFGAGLRRIGAGLFSEDDLRRNQADWVDALGVEVWDHVVWTVPPASQGYLTLAAARIAETIGLRADQDLHPFTDRWVHLLVESARLAGSDRPEVLHEGADGRALVSHERLDPRAATFDDRRRGPGRSPGAEGDTIYLCAADRDGMAVSLVQSNARGWGVHLAVPEVGIFLQLLARLLVAGQSPAACVGAPRWRLGDGGFDTWDGDGPGHVGVEENAPAAWAEGLAARGHVVQTDPAWNSGYGHAHLIERTEDGVLAGAHDPRALTGSTATW